MSHLNKIRLTLVPILCAMVTGCASAETHTGAAQCESVPNDLLVTPNGKAPSRLVKDGEYDCWGVVASSSESLARLYAEVSAGNERAARYLLKHIHELDGGELEDALNSLGKFSDKSPHMFLELAREGALSKRTMEDALTMLPLELGDDLQAQLDFIRNRKRKLLSVSAANLRGQRRIALAAVDAFELEIIRAMKP